MLHSDRAHRRARALGNEILHARGRELSVTVRHFDAHQNFEVPRVAEFATSRLPIRRTAKEAAAGEKYRHLCTLEDYTRLPQPFLPSHL